MHDVNKLLVPIDFSQESANALMYASSLAKQIKAELIALHVVEDITAGESPLSFVFPPEGWPFFDGQPRLRPLDVLLRERALDLWNFIDRTIRDSSPTKVKRLVRLGSLRAEIDAVARQEHIDLIVFELRKRFLFTGMATRRLLKMINKLPYPVLLAPPIEEDTPTRGKRLRIFQRIPAENPA